MGFFGPLRRLSQPNKTCGSNAETEASMLVSPTVRADQGPTTHLKTPISPTPNEEYTLAVIVNPGRFDANVRISLYKHVDGLLKGASDLFNSSVPATIKCGKYFFTLPGEAIERRTV
jgi:hypothetical protein